MFYYFIFFSPKYSIYYGIIINYNIRKDNENVCIIIYYYIRCSYHDVDAERLDHFGHRRPFQERVERRALERVAGVQEQCAVHGVGGLGPFLVRGRLDARETAVTRVDAVVHALAAGPVYLVEIRVHVVGVQN